MKKKKEKRDYYYYKIGLFFVFVFVLYLLFPNFFRKSYDPTFNEISLINKYYALIEEAIPIYGDLYVDNPTIATNIDKVDYLFAAPYHLEIQDTSSWCEDRHFQNEHEIRFFFKCIIDKNSLETYDRDNLFTVSKSNRRVIKYMYSTSYEYNNENIITDYNVELIKQNDQWKINSGTLIFDIGDLQYHLVIGV